ncbi:MAG: hypothetical protein AAB308_06050, partial [Nitrospirota bacterium]
VSSDPSKGFRHSFNEATWPYCCGILACSATGDALCEVKQGWPEVPFIQITDRSIVMFDAATHCDGRKPSLCAWQFPENQRFGSS